MSIKDNLNLDDFKSRVGMGTRPNRYSVSMGIPGSSYQLQAEVSALTFPDSNVPPIGIPFRGRILKLPGDRRYSTWGFTVYDTDPSTSDGGGSGVWRELHEWSERINTHVKNITPFNYDNDTANWSITHYSLNGNSALKKITLHNCWPTNVGPFELAYGAMDSLSQFSCQVEYEYFTVDNV